MSTKALVRLCTSSVCVLAIVSCGLIVASYSRLSHTWDEPTHVVAGLELLEKGRYTLQTENPPLSRIPLAIVPYWNGARVPSGDEVHLASPVSSIYYRNDHYVRNVTEARVANLLFFVALLVMTWLLAGGRSRPLVAALATGIVATLPPIVAHSGLATTDISFTAAFLLLVWRWQRLIERPMMRSAAWCGVALGLAMATKFSTIAFFPPIALSLVIVQFARGSRPKLSLRPFVSLAAAGLSVTAVVIWAAYGFRVGKLADLPQTFGAYGVMPATGPVTWISNVTLPAHEFIHGLLYLKVHADWGHSSYMLGQVSSRGFWFFYPIGLLVKTPILTLLAFVGGVLLVFLRRTSRASMFAGYALGAAGILAMAVASPINIGLRHVFVVYPLLALAAAYGIVREVDRIDRRWLKAAAIAAVPATQMVLLAVTFPRELSYFNALAGRDPGAIISDSDLDWGQDVLAMEEYFQQRPVPELYVLTNGSALFCRHKLPPLKALPVNRQVNGWIAVFDFPYRVNRGWAREVCADPEAPPPVDAPRGWLNWLHARTPVARIGSGVLLFHVTDIPETSTVTRREMPEAEP